MGILNEVKLQYPRGLLQYIGNFDRQWSGARWMSSGCSSDYKLGVTACRFEFTNLFRRLPKHYCPYITNYFEIYFITHNMFSSQGLFVLDAGFQRSFEDKV